VIKKVPPPTSGSIKKSETDPELRFSFKFFDSSDAEICPQSFRDGYTQTLMERLKALSGMKVKEFAAARNKALRIHTHEWPRTTRKAGFPNLVSEYRDTPGWQFGLSANKHGRVHGMLINDTFYVIWLDHHHVLYGDGGNG
jgi:hypothetical protein